MKTLANASARSNSKLPAAHARLILLPEWTPAIVVSRSWKTRGLRSPRAAQLRTTADSSYGENNARPPICAIRDIRRFT